MLAAASVAQSALRPLKDSSKNKIVCNRERHQCWLSSLRAPEHMYVCVPTYMHAQVCAHARTRTLNKGTIALFNVAQFQCLRHGPPCCGKRAAVCTACQVQIQH